MKKIVAILALLFIAQANATDLSHKFGIGGSFGFPIPMFGNNFNEVADAEWAASVHGRYHFDPLFGLELSLSKEGFKDTPMNFENINLLGFWRVYGAADLTPVFGVGAGVTRISDYLPQSAKLSLLARAGIDYALLPALSFGALLDYQYVSKILGEMPKGAAHVLTPQLALTWYFGAEKEKVPAPEVPAVPAKVSKTESDTVSVAAASTMRDENKPVLTIEFDTNKSEIKSSYIEQMKNIADKLREDNTLSGFIEGHTDSTGPKTFNNHLSLKRAEAVRQKLMEFGVGQKQLKVEGYGDRRPVADNSTPEGRQQNRRASVILIVIKSNLSDNM